jgi:hypothetical protein
MLGRWSRSTKSAFRSHLDEVVRATVEETLSALLDAEADQSQKDRRLELRAEAFNATNTPVFSAPDTYLPDGQGYFGVVSSSANTARQLQLAVKFYF